MAPRLETGEAHLPNTNRKRVQQNCLGRWAITRCAPTAPGGPHYDNKGEAARAKHPQTMKCSSIWPSIHPNAEGETGPP